MGYSRHETINKQRKLVSKSQRYKRKLLVNVFKIILVCLVTIVIAAAGAGFGMMKGILDSAPDLDSINLTPKGFKTIIYDQDGNATREISTINSNREYVYYDEIPQDLINAFVAIEDQRFWEHNGIDVKGIFRVVVKGIMSRDFAGASTITQQLIKNNVFQVGLNETTFLDSLERKIQEQYLALEVEKIYTKEEILELYLNTIYMGRGCHGVKSACKRYFDKELSELTVSECAALAGITKNPSAYDPVLFPEQSGKRRMIVLEKMLELEYINELQYDQAKLDPVYDRIKQVSLIRQEKAATYSYYEDAIIDQLIEDFMEIYDCTEQEASNLIYSGGYSVFSVQDAEIQAICDEVINDDSYVGGTKVGLDYRMTIMLPDETTKNYSMENMITYFKITTGNNKYNNIYKDEEAARLAADEYKEYVLDDTDGTIIAESFNISPQPQFSFTIMDQKTGYVKAMVGGKGEKKVDRGLNRATNSPRQPGSVFKILAAYLPLYDQDLGGLATTYLDEPYKFANGIKVSNWYGEAYRGFCSTRLGIQDSMNILAVKAITDATPTASFEYLTKLGFTTLADGTKVDTDGTVLTDVTQSSALGGLTYGVTTYEVTAAFAAIANGGVYTKPVLYSKVLDHDGNVVIDNTTPETREVMKPSTAWQLIDGMRSVLSSGTGGPAKMRTGIDCAGKTGTTSSAYDLWLAGMTPYYTASIWMGFDYNTSMNGMNQAIHEVMWRDIMDRIATLEGQVPGEVIMQRPSDVQMVELCQISNMLPGEDCPTTRDYMARSAIPSKSCEGHEFVEYCMESHKVATENCPEKKKFVVLIKEDEQTHEEVKELVGATEEFVYTEEICELHPAGEKVMINTEAGEGGSISESVECNKGDTVTVYITPFTGYKIDDVIVDGTSVGPKTSYTIENVQGNVSIKAVFKKTGNGGGGNDPTTTQSTTQTTTQTTTETTETTQTTTEQTTTEQTTETPPEGTE